MRPSITYVARLLYGHEWTGPLSGALDVHIRTVERWKSGDREPPDTIWPEVAKLIKDQLGRLAEIADNLENKTLHQLIVQHGISLVDVLKRLDGIALVDVLKRLDDDE